ncbi:MAG: NADPH:quinone oxidoreductase family protein [Pseudomonadota bacterium]
MKALICEAFGPYKSHKVKEVDAPEIKPGHVRVAVRAAGVNFPDILIVEGKYQLKPPFPFIPGSECAGVVSELGEGVTDYKIGDEVFFGAMHGAFAEEVVVPTALLFRVPKDMSFEQASAVNLVYGTSYHALKDRAEVKPGDKVFVLGAAGGVGLAAVELAKAMGATVIAGASSDEKCEVARQHGADMVINYVRDDIKETVRQLTRGGVDVVYDPVGDALAEPAFRTLTWGGRYLVVGFAGGDIPRLPLNLTLLKSADVRGVFWGQWLARNPEAHRQNTNEFLEMFEKGQIKPRISAAYPLADFVKAYDDLAERRAMGKVVLTMGG